MIIPDEKSLQLQKDESLTSLPSKKENDGKSEYLLSNFINILFILFFLERGKGREKWRETTMCKRNKTSCFLHTPIWGPGPQPRHLPNWE